MHTTPKADVFFHFILFQTEIPVGPDQMLHSDAAFCSICVLMPRSAASDLGLHCLSRSHKRDARLIGVI